MGEGKTHPTIVPSLQKKRLPPVTHGLAVCYSFFLRLLLQTFNHLSEENITYKQVYSMLPQVKDLKTLISIIWGILEF